MKNIFLGIPLVLGSLIFTSCGQSEIKSVPQEKSNIVRTEQGLLLSCDPKHSDELLKKIQELPPNSIVTNISMDADCEKARIPKALLTALTQKPFYTVHWFPGFIDKTTYYVFTDNEIHLIAKTPWKWFATEKITPTQYRILRNEKTSMREGFEPAGSSDYYTKAEQEKCDAGLSSYSGSDEEQMKRVSDKRVQCYKNLPPLP